MIRCQRCGAYMVWSYEKGWHCPNGCEVGIYTTDYATEATRGADHMGDISSLAKASQMIIAELEAKLSKAEHDRDRYRERIATEKHRADVAEEALKISCENCVECPCIIEDNNKYCKAGYGDGTEECDTSKAYLCWAEYYTQQAEQFGKED